MILITGHKGFVGEHLTKLLDERGVEWLGYDLVDGDDIRNKFKVESVFYENSIDVVINLAALASPIKSMLHPEEYISTNITALQFLLDCAKRYKIKHFISFSSSSVYGEQAPPSKEDGELKPFSVYAITKACGEMLVRASEVPYTIIRPFTLYGLNGRKDQVVYKWINLLKQKKPIVVYGDGTNKRGYTYINDLVKAVADLIFKEEALNQTFNLGGTQIVSTYELAEMFKRIYECEIQYKPEIAYLPMLKGDIYENWADISKAKELLGFNPKEDFENNIEQIIKQELK